MGSERFTSSPDCWKTKSRLDVHNAIKERDRPLSRSLKPRKMIQQKKRRNPNHIDVGIEGRAGPSPKDVIVAITGKSSRVEFMDS